MEITRIFYTLLTEQVNSATRQKFVKWLKANDIEFEKSGNKDSTYYNCFFDNDTNDPIELKVRFSNHKAGYYGDTVDVDTYEDDIKTFADILKALEKHGVVIQGGKYMGSLYATTLDLEKGSDTYAQYKKYNIPLKRGKPNW